ncbi:MAPEG family protein [Roseibium polysiphoniae]|uniref:MAPEG family protein n=1 Tax=Roseibium polysiphoniae TaxID=2571221 RepID=A0ABR9CF08_9HYPH|nr:MAPEG family protein [Roseibium polysiphoniae]MBD8878203.1 MAPEG family protein [Roseibium polysiphoniae]
MPIEITPIYAGILALFYVFLSARVIGLRRRLWISVGDKGNQQLLRRQRVHGNFSEYAPMCLILMIGLELMLAPVWLVHGLGVMLLVGRVLHAYGIGREPESLTLRTIGMVLTFAVLIIGGLASIIQAILMADFAG